MKKNISLNFDWHFISSFEPRFIEGEFDFGVLHMVDLPHSVETVSANYFDSFALNKVVTYFKKIHLKKEYAGSRIFLNFEGVLSYCEVYVNGIFVASHKGEAPFSADISVALKLDEDSIIVIKVDSTVRADVPSFGLNGPNLSYGGIFRQVSLSVQNAETIRDVFVKCDAVLMDEKSLTVDIELSDFYPDTSLKVHVLDKSERQVGSLPEKAVLRPQTTIKGVISDVDLWDTQNPVMYTLQVQLIRKEKVLDERRINFGFRQAIFTRNGFILNGKKLKLLGLNRFDSYAYFGRSACEDLQRRDAQILRRELGCNAVRMHGVPSKAFVDECNKIGLLIITDLSGDGYLGKSEWREALLETISQQVKAYRNCPSIIAWGTRINNSADYDELYFKTNKAAKDLDPTRQTIGARSFMGSRLYEDVFAFNDYTHRKSGLSKLKSTGSLFVPYIVSEHSGRLVAAKPFGEQKTKTTQALKHTQMLNEVFKNEKICGVIGMSFADFHSASHKGCEDNQSYYGVCDIYRNKKPAAFVYKSQTAQEPVLEPTSTSLNADEMQNTDLVIFTNCEKLRVLRNGEEVGVFAPSKKRFKYLPHPPVIIPTKKIKTIKGRGILSQSLLDYLFSKSEKNGGVLSYSFLDKALFKLLAMLLKLQKEELEQSFCDNSLNAEKPTVLKIEGLKGDEVVITRTIGSFERLSLFVENAPKQIVTHKERQAVCVTVSMRDNFGNTLPYFNAPINIKADGKVAILGGGNAMMQGGRCSFYLVAERESGKAKIEIECNGMEIKFETEVIYESVAEL